MQRCIYFFISPLCGHLIFIVILDSIQYISLWLIVLLWVVSPPEDWIQPFLTEACHQAAGLGEP